MSVRARVNRFSRDERGAALAITVIVLALLGLLGIAALNTTDMEMMIAANERDHKEAFFYADSGVGVGTEMIEQTLKTGTAPDPAAVTVNDPDFLLRDTSWNDGSAFSVANSSFVLHVGAGTGTYVRVGGVVGHNAGFGNSVGSAYHGPPGKDRYGTKTDYLIRSHRDGSRHGKAEVDLGWRHHN